MAESLAAHLVQGGHVDVGSAHKSFMESLNQAITDELSVEDKLNAEAKLTFDEAKRRDLLIRASNIINEDLPVLVLLFGKSIFAYADHLGRVVALRLDSAVTPGPGSGERRKA